MSEEEDLLRAVVDRPAEAGQTWLVLADWLDERGRSAQAELIRLEYEPDYRPDLDAAGRQWRIVELLVAGVRPCVPTWTNDLGMGFVWCPPGTFTMGSPATEPGRYGDEDQHPVRLTRGFWLGATVVTQAQWRAVTGESPANQEGDDLPVERISWQDCEEFLRRLVARDGRPYRFPTEAEWEYACRAGTQTPFFWGNLITSELANYNAATGDDGGPPGEYRDRTMPANAFPPNAWGLHQMHGNVWEWCADWYARYPTGEATDPVGAEDGVTRLARGGTWRMFTRRLRSADRSLFRPDERRPDLGLRVACTRGGP
jgi:uncharacterized protein (TIGR02996 family)